MATEFLQEKINTLRAQVRQAQLEIFANQLLVQDGTGVIEDKKAKATIEAQKSNAISTIAVWERKLAVRVPILEALEKELAEQKQAEPAVRDLPL